MALADLHPALTRKHNAAIALTLLAVGIAAAACAFVFTGVTSSIAMVLLGSLVVGASVWARRSLPAVRNAPVVMAFVPLVSVVLVFAAVYFSWAVAYAKLGRRPLPSIDDPGMIGGFSTGVYVFCLCAILLLLINWAVTCLLALQMGFARQTKRRGIWWLGFAAGVAAFSVLIFLPQHPPDNVIVWFMD